MDLNGYDTGPFYDELFAAPGQPRPGSRVLLERLKSLTAEEVAQRQRDVERALAITGATFNVYGEDAGLDRIFPFDLIPRIVSAQDWLTIERGLKQRIGALNAFLNDVYHDQRIIKDGVVPGELVHSSAGFRPACIGIDPPLGIWCHIVGTDLVRDADGQLYVLEDNLRTPSGISYVLENRRVLKQAFPRLFEGIDVLPVENYPSLLLDVLQSLAPAGGEGTVVVLTPGHYNSAYFEHSYLAQHMGVDLVEGSDLVVADSYVWLRTTRGLQRVDVIYRRVDDDFLDPLVFRSDSLLGVPGLMDVFRAGHVGIVNAPGSGVADDKALYRYVPDIIRYYTGEEPLIANVPTHVCAVADDREYVLSHLEQLVVKTTGGSGGYGMLIGPHSTEAEREVFRQRIEADPRGYIAQPVISLSRAPTLIDGRLEGRHVDFRPFVLSGRDIQVLPGGLTRVALRKGSLVVNSSQGGGSKDTWVLRAPAVPAEGGV